MDMGDTSGSAAPDSRARRRDEDGVMKSVTIPLTIIGVYASSAFAAALTETIMLYPNIFRDVPESLAQTQQFMSEVAVGDAMRPLGGALTMCALIACAAAVRYRLARARVLATV